MYDFSHCPGPLKCSSQDCHLKSWIVFRDLVIPEIKMSKGGRGVDRLMGRELR